MANLAGKDMLDQSPDQVVLNTELLYNINMGYSDPKKLQPGDSILYHATECEFQHVWSMESITEQYEFHKLKDYISLKDYLTMPSFQVDQMLKGLSKGRIKRREEDARRRKIEAEKKKNDPTRGLGGSQDMHSLDPTTAELLASINPEQLPLL